MNRFLLRWVINAVALYIAVTIVPGIRLQAGGSNQWVAFVVLGLIFGFLNALLRPFLLLLTCPLIILTLGLGTLLVNTLLFYLTGWIGAQFGWGFVVQDFWSALLGALVVSVVSLLMSMILKDELRR